MMLAASAGWLHQFWPPAPSGFQQFTAWAHSSILNEPWFQNFILAVSAAIAIWTISSSSRHERRRATVDLVRDQQKDEVLNSARAVIRPLKDASGRIDFGPILAEKDDDARNAIQAIYDLLNSYEFMASGLRTKAFDESTYKRMYYNNVVRDWNTFRSFIEQYREKYRAENPGVAGLSANTLYQDFQTLATRWSKHPLKRNRISRGFLKKGAAAPVQAPVAQTQPPAQTQASAPPKAPAQILAPVPTQQKPTSPPQPPAPKAPSN